MRKFSLVLILLVTWVTMATAEVPRIIHYQGYLTNVTGDPIDCPDAFNCNQSFTLTYRIYNQELGGSAVWLEAHTNLPIFQGAFHSLLGSTSPLIPANLGDEAWLSIAINNEIEMMPRQRVASAAYALRSDTASEAINAENLGGMPAIDYVTGPHFSGDWADLSNRPDGLDDGDDNTQLGETEVDNYVSNNGYAVQDDLDALLASLSTLASTASFTDLVDVPAGLADGDDNTQLGETEVDNFVANNGYAVQDDLDALLASLSTLASTASFTDLVDVPAGLADGDDDTVGALVCDPGEVAQYNGANWSCSNAVSGVGTTEPAPCGADTIGRMYFDSDTNSLRLCDGTAYRKIKICSEICPISSTVACALTVEDDCGTSCGELGTGMNSNQCATASTVSCGTSITDSCGNSCGEGTSLDETECNIPGTACGIAVLDTCGNACGTTGTFCSSSTDKCSEGTCIPSCGDLILDPGEECDDGNISDGDSCSSNCTVSINVSFTTCGKDGRNGPSQNNCNAAYLGTGLDGAVTVGGGIQTWIAPVTATYRITVNGAQGGAGSGSSGGLGTQMRGDFNIGVGTELRILVGQEGSKGPSCSSDCLGGGGGGTYVFYNSTDEAPLIAAGGGGGANYETNGDAATASLNGNNGPAMSSGGGTNGNGGSSVGSSQSGAGAGWLTDGAISYYGCEFSGSAAKSPRNGGTGGQGNDPSTQTGEGGFGGGGGGAVECGQTGGGGGGGYSGGGGSTCSSTMSCGGPGGGGGSFNSGSSPASTGGVNSGTGSVQIEKL